MDQIRTKGGVLLGALVSGALAVGSLGAAPSANATCASFWGINNGGGCTSTLFTAAIAIGTGAKATATGLFGAAFAIGSTAQALTSGNFTFATAVGTEAIASAGGLFGVAAHISKNGFSEADGLLNIAIDVSPANTGPDEISSAKGVGNIGVNLFGKATATGQNATFAGGYFNIATNFLGTNSRVLAGTTTKSFWNVAFNALGSGNNVTAGPGPFAVAGALNQHNVTVAQASPGINVYTSVALGAASVGCAKTGASTAAASSHSGPTQQRPTVATASGKPTPVTRGGRAAGRARTHQNATGQHSRDGWRRSAPSRGHQPSAPPRLRTNGRHKLAL